MTGAGAAGVAFAVLGVLGVLGGSAMFGQKKDKGHAWMAQVGALVILTCTMVFSWGACSSQTLVYYVGDLDTNELDFGIGVFTVHFSASDAMQNGGSTVNTCDSEAIWQSDVSAYGPEDGDCRRALAHRCHAGQTFAMFGVLTNIAVVTMFGLIMAGRLPVKPPKLVLPASVFVISFCYMVVFSVWDPVFRNSKVQPPPGIVSDPPPLTATPSMRRVSDEP